MTMNSTLSTITSENSNKYDYFKLLVDKNKIKLSADLVEDKIKPKFDKFTSTSYFLNNILNIVITKKLLNNFSVNVREYKYLKNKDNFKNLIRYNRPLLVKTLMDILEEALKETELKIPTGYDSYYINTSFPTNKQYNIVGEIIHIGQNVIFMDCEWFVKQEYITPKKYKKFILDQFKHILITINDTNLIIAFDRSYHCYEEYYTKNNNHTCCEINFGVIYKKHKTIENMCCNQDFYKLIK